MAGFCLLLCKNKMNKKIKATVGILTFNSAKTLKRTLDSVRDFEEIIICDGGSTDTTLSVAREYKCKIINQGQRAKNADNTISDFSMARNQCLGAASFDWFLYIDSDEVVSLGLSDEIRRITSSSLKKYVYKIPMRIFVNGRMIKYSSNYPGYQTRFFNRKSGAYFIKTVHERIDYDKQKFVAEPLSSPWYVFMTDDEVKNYFQNNLGYAKREAVRHANISLRGYIKWILYGNIKIIIKIAVKTFRNYAMHGFRDTMPFSVELGRILYAMAIIYFITKSKLVQLVYSK